AWSRVGDRPDRGSPEHYGMNGRDRQRHEHASEDDIAEEMRPLRDAHQADGKTGQSSEAQQQGCRMGNDQTGRLERQEWGRRFPANEGAVAGALPAWYQRGSE